VLASELYLRIRTLPGRRFVGGLRPGGRNASGCSNPGTAAIIKHTDPQMEMPEQQVDPQQPEFRDPRFAELDEQLQAQTANRASAKPAAQKRRRSSPTIPRALLKDIVRAARELRKRHGALFIADANLRDRAARLFRSMLPPKPRRRGRPALDSVTVATRLLRRLKRLYADEKPSQIWARIYPVVIPNYESLSATEKKDAGLLLRNRVRSRRNRRRQSFSVS
jgi:hypothetical protein